MSRSMEVESELAHQGLAELWPQNFDQSKWGMGEETNGGKDIPVRERGEGEKEEFLWGQFHILCGFRCRHWGRKRGKGQSAPECELVPSAGCVVLSKVLHYLSEPFLLDTVRRIPDIVGFYCRIFFMSMRLNEIMHVECLRREGPSTVASVSCPPGMQYVY